MLTPQEVAEHAFTKASFGGYNMAMVDEFLDLLTADYTTLYKENAALKTKMKVLAEKIEEYRSTEEVMRKALLSAQQIADQMVAEGEKQKEQMLAQAEAEVKARMEGLQQEVENEKLRLTAAQNATTAYISKLKELHEHELRYLASLGKLTAAPAQPDPVEQAATAINDAVEKAIEEDFADVQPPLEEDSLYEELRRGPVAHTDSYLEGEDDDTDEAGEESAPAGKEEPSIAPFPVQDKPQEEDGEAEDTKPTRRIFGELKFGKDYKAEE